MVTPGGTNPSKAFAPAADRNRRPIGQVIARALPPTGLVLEIASGTGQHVEHFAGLLPDLVWQPSDISRSALASIRARVGEAALANLRSPIELDVTRVPWPIDRADAVLCINMIHVAPWEATGALFEGSARILAEGRPLITYGPYREQGRTAPSNDAFDQSLRRQNPTWGVRDVVDVQRVAREHGFVLERRVSMPANNLTLVWTRTRSPGQRSG